MPDYGQELRFGLFMIPDARRSGALIESALLADDLGLDYVTIQDHPYQPRFLEMWTLLTTIAAKTTNIRVAPNVANLPLRHPMMLARSAASLAILSGGRVDLGLGAGAFWDGIVAEGGPRRSPGESVSALTEAMAIIAACWRGEGTVDYVGEHYTVAGAEPGPAPQHPIETWLGAYKPRMLTLTGAQADGWVPSMGYADPAALIELSARLDDALDRAGRPHDAVRRIYNINGRFGDGAGFLEGGTADWAEQLAELTLTTGMSTYLLSARSPDMLRLFAEEVVPYTRALVERERAGGGDEDAASDSASERVPQATTGEQRTPFAAVATPDSRPRVSDEQLLDEENRPTATVPDPDRLYTRAEQAAGRHLIDVHDQLRSELDRLRSIIDQVGRGELSAAAARSHLDQMTIRQNAWTMGLMCIQYCRAVTGHHSLEDASVFPHLERSEPALKPVLSCLQREHKIIAIAVERIDRQLARFAADESAFDDVRAAVDRLSDALLSHLSYEERELIEPLARLGFY